MKKFILLIPLLFIFKFNSFAMETYSLNPPAGNTSYTYSNKTSGSIIINLPSSVSGTTPINISGTIPASSFQLPSGASIVDVSLSVSIDSFDVYYGQTSASGLNYVNRYTKLQSGSISKEENLQSYSQASLNGTYITSFPNASISGLTSLSSASINLRSTVGTSQSLSGGSSSKSLTVYYTWTITYKVSGGTANFFLWSSLSSNNNTSAMGFYIPNLPKYEPGLYYINLSATGFPTNWINTNFSLNCIGYGTSYGSLSGTTSADHSTTLGIFNGIYISGYVYIDETFSDSLVFMSSFDKGKIPNYEGGWYSTDISIDIIPSTDFDEDIIFPDILEYPPAFPQTTGLVYSSQGVKVPLESYSIKSSGAVVPDGYDYTFVELNYTLNFSSYYTFTTGSYLFSFYNSGIGNIEGSYPAFLKNYDTYVVNAYFTNFNSTNKNNYFNLDAFNFSNWQYANNLYFSVIFPTAYVNNVSFKVIYFTSTDVPSFNFNYTITENGVANNLYVSDSQQILKELQKNNDSMTSAGGANNELNDQNKLVQSTLDDYQRETDTSAQYSKITNDIFVVDTGIFTNLASTISLFSACVNGIFNHIGDLNVVPILFLTLTLISVIIGITHFRGW